MGFAGLVGIDHSLLDVQAHDVEVNINTFYVPAVPAPVNLAIQLLGPPAINYALSPSFKDFTEDVNHNGVIASPAPRRPIISTIAMRIAGMARKITRR